MAEDENADIRPPWTDALRRVLERLDRAIPLPAKSPIDRTLQSGSVSRVPVNPIDDRDSGLEVMDGDRSITLTVEFSGVNRTDIDLQVTKRTLVLSFNSSKGRYYREIDLPVEVRPDSAKTTFENGVLDVVLEKSEDMQDRGGER